jgi:type IV secretory pathway VirB9-like protein
MPPKLTSDNKVGNVTWLPFQVNSVSAHLQLFCTVTNIFGHQTVAIFESIFGQWLYTDPLLKKTLGNK